MRRTLPPLLLALISACASVPDSDSAVKVYNLRQGLARVDASGNWQIYAEGNNFLHQVNGSCVANGKATPCMWFAVAFEFSASAETTVLSCKGSFSEPTDVVTPKEVVAQQATENTGTIELQGSSGKVFWQGYSIADGNTKPHTTSVICRHAGKEVLRYAFTITEQPNSTVETDARKSGARGSP
jgi:hypothetical protein